MFIEHGTVSPDHLSISDTGDPCATRAAALGHAHFAVKQWAAARENYVEANRLCPGEAQYAWLIGLCDWALDHIDSAGVHFHDAVRINPAFAPAHAWLGEWHLHHRMTVDALRCTARAMELDANFPGNMQARAAVLCAAGEHDAAWQLFVRLLAAGHMTPALASLHAKLAPRRNLSATAIRIPRTSEAASGLGGGVEGGEAIAATS
jgi:tetratricopeptide (TPR) repeat protein